MRTNSNEKNFQKRSTTLRKTIKIESYRKNTSVFLLPKAVFAKFKYLPHKYPVITTYFCYFLFQRNLFNFLIIL